MHTHTHTQFVIDTGPGIQSFIILIRWFLHALSYEYDRKCTGEDDCNTLTRLSSRSRSILARSFLDWQLAYTDTLD